MLKCQTCDGVYRETTSDGLTYYHRCPPLSAVELQAAVDAGLVQLPKDETAATAVTLRTYERASLRDENVKGGKGTDANDVKRAGMGVLEVPDSDAPPPIVVVPGTSPDPIQR